MKNSIMDVHAILSVRSLDEVEKRSRQVPGAKKRCWNW
jgi:hypothetical protein